MVPPEVEPIRLFRTVARNLPMTTAMHQWGSYELSRKLTLSLREREIVIDRTCARCGAEYEWGVHVSFFGERAALSPGQIASLTHGSADDDCWTDPRERLAIRAVDSLHDVSDLGDSLWDELREHFTEVELLDLVALCGWYHAISFLCRAMRIDLEDDAPRFADQITLGQHSGCSIGSGSRS
jgi:alkylhydroperoxidase family enzyme